jgi:hypothetical protein
VLSPDSRETGQRVYLPRAVYGRSAWWRLSDVACSDQYELASGGSVGVEELGQADFDVAYVDEDHTTSQAAWPAST